MHFSVSKMEWLDKQKKAEEELTKAFENWLAKQSVEDLRQLARRIWRNYSLRLWLLPYGEILEEKRRLSKGYQG